MKSLVSWLHRLADITPDGGPVVHLFRVLVPGFQPLDVVNWLLSVDPQGSLPFDIHASGPESLSMIRLPDLPGREANIHERHQLGADLASLFSLALNVRVTIPHVLDINVPQLNKHIFQPFSQIIDRNILGPIPNEPKQRIETYLSKIAGLAEDDLGTISAASSAYHASLLLFDREARVAYTLLVAGIEILSRKYGAPPTDWTEWDESDSWDNFIGTQQLTSGQAAAIRERLMKDKHLRLGATFRNYAAYRLSDAFWEKPWEEWIYGINANQGTWLPANPLKARIISDILPKDRIGLQRALGKSYGLRSSIVHEGDWVELLSLSPPPVPALDLNRPLPFAILRAILAELIWYEISTHSQPCCLPDFQLLRPNAKSEPNQANAADAKSRAAD